jgi:hypothetical protein
VVRGYRTTANFEHCSILGAKTNNFQFQRVNSVPSREIHISLSQMAKNFQLFRDEALASCFLEESSQQKNANLGSKKAFEDFW